MFLVLLLLLQPLIISTKPTITSASSSAYEVGVDGAGDGVSSDSSSSSPNHQTPQGSLFESFASQAKEFMLETARPNGQEGLMSHIDKVYVCVCSPSNYNLHVSLIIICT